MVKVLDQSATTLSQERSLNLDWGVVEPQWIVLGLRKNHFLFYSQKFLLFLYNYYRIFNNKPIVKSDEDDILVIETLLKRL